MQTKVKEIRVAGAVIMVVESNPFDPKKRIENDEAPDVELESETANQLRKLYKTRKSRNLIPSSNSQRYQRDNIIRSGGSVDTKRVYDFRNHRFEEPHKVGRRQSIRFLPLNDSREEEREAQLRMLEEEFEREDAYDASPEAEESVIRKMIEKSGDPEFVFRTTNLVGAERLWPELY